MIFSDFVFSKENSIIDEGENMMNEISLKLFSNAQLIPIVLTCVLVSIGICLCFKAARKSFKSDLFAMVLITSLYAVVSIWQIGSFSAPTTWWQPQQDNEFITFEITEENPAFDGVYIIGGEGNNNALISGYQIGLKNLQILGSNDNLKWDTVAELSNGSFMDWEVVRGDWNYRYVSLVSQDLTMVVNEFGLKKAGENSFLTLTPFVNSNPTNPYNATNVIDEQDTLVVTPTYMNGTYFDEIYHPRNAWEIANNQDMYASVHPLLGTSIIAVGIKIFGMNPFGWRIMGALFGIMILPLFYLLTKKLFNNRFLSTLGTALFASDFMLITTSRIGTLEPFSIFFILLMTYFMVCYIKSDFIKTPLKKQFLYLAASGITMGIACSVKWTGCYAAVGLAILFFTHFIYYTNKYLKLKKSEDIEDIEYVKVYRSKAIKIILWCCLFFVLVPAIIYACSFIPTRVWKNDSWSIANVIKHSVGMYDYHANLEATHPYQSVWWQWLFDIRPIWYYSNNFNNGTMQTISCFNNPLISLAGVFSIVVTAINTYKTKSQTGFIILVGYFSALLPWVLVDRCIFAYHYYPSIPFLILAIVYTAKLIMDKYTNGKKIVLIYAACCILLFIIFMPVLTGFTTNTQYVRLLQWLPSWYFGG